MKKLNKSYPLSLSRADLQAEQGLDRLLCQTTPYTEDSTDPMEVGELAYPEQEPEQELRF